MLSINEIKGLLKSWQYDDDEGWYAWQDIQEYYGCDTKPILIQGLGLVSVVDAYTGAEGGGEYCYMIFKIFNNEGIFYYKTTGTYSSFAGAWWNDDLKKVNPIEKSIIVYEEEK